jgi:hypothetical protein
LIQNEKAKEKNIYERAKMVEGPYCNFNKKSSKTITDPI